jgi:UDP-galactopyranose mutase
MKKVVIAGAGPSGLVIARRYAEQGNKVLVIEERDHIAGNLYDYKNDDGIIIHKYGPHIFQTSDDQVIEYVKSFGE